MYDEIWTLLDGRVTQSMKVCLPSCRSINVIIKKTDELTNMIDHAWLNIIANNKVTVYTDIHAHTLLNLVVDLGRDIGKS